MRYGYESDFKERTKLLDLVAHQLRSLAHNKHVAVKHNFVIFHGHLISYDQLLHDSHHLLLFTDSYHESGDFPSGH